MTKKDKSHIALVATPLFLPIAEYIVSYLTKNGIPAVIARIEEERFADGETCPHILDNIRHKKIYFLSEVEVGKQAENAWKSLVLMDAMRRASGGKITVIYPYFSYARQERRKGGARVPISAKAHIRHLEVAGAKRIFSIDLHANAIEGFSDDAPIEHLNGRVVLAEHARKLFPDGFGNVISLSADTGGVERNKKLAMRLDESIRIMSGEKRRSGTNNVSEWHLMGDWSQIAGSDIIMHDDICDTASTLLIAAEKLFAGGAKSITALCTHGTFSFKGRKAEDKLRESGVKVIVTDSIPRTKEYYAANADWLTMVSIGSVLGEAVRRDILGESISEMNGD